MAPKYESFHGILPSFEEKFTDPATGIKTEITKIIYQDGTTLSRSDESPENKTRRIDKYTQGDKSYEYYFITEYTDGAFKNFFLRTQEGQNNELDINDHSENFYFNIGINYTHAGNFVIIDVSAKELKEEEEEEKTDYHLNLDTSLGQLLNWYRIAGREVLHFEYMLHARQDNTPETPKQLVVDTDLNREARWTQEKLEQELPKVETTVNYYLKTHLAGYGLTDKEFRDFSFYLSRSVLEDIASIYSEVDYTGSQIRSYLTEAVSQKLKFHQSRIRERQHETAFFTTLPNGEFNMEIRQNDARPKEDWKVLRTETFKENTEYFSNKYTMRDLGDYLELTITVGTEKVESRKVKFPKKVPMVFIKDLVKDETKHLWPQAFELYPTVYTK